VRYLRFLCTILAGVALGASAFAADPQLLRMVPTDAQVVAGLDVGKLKNSPLGQYLLTQLSAQESHLQGLEAMTGFNPRRDVMEIVSAARGPNQKSGVVLLRGNFDKGKILGLLTANGQTLNLYQGVEMLANPNGRDAVALVDNSLVVLGSSDNVKAVLDRRGSGAAMDAALNAKIDRLSGAFDAWMVTTLPVADLAGAVPDRNASGILKGDVWKKIRQASGGMKFGSMVEMSGEAEATSAQDATALADVVRFLVSMVQMQAPQDVPEALLKALRTANVSSAESTVKVSLAMPSADLETLLQQQMQKGPRKRAAR
jgi:hypothetical protein